MAVLVFFGYNVFALLFYFLIGSFQQFIISISLIIVLYLANIIHSIFLAKKIKNQVPLFKPKWYIYAGFVFIYLMIVYEVRKPFIDKYFPIELASIASTSMDPTLFIGDHIAFDKDADFKIDDLVELVWKEDLNNRVCHRLSGGPGDLIKLQNGQLIRNNVELIEKNIRLRFFIQPKNLNNIDQLLNDYNITDAFELGEGKLMIHICPEDLKNLIQDERMIEVSTDPRMELQNDSTLFPNSTLKEFRWTAGNYGPLRVPKKGWKIQLDSVNADLYQSSILEENPELEFKNHQILENGIALSSYEFKRDYYFVLGDNRYNSLDSRYLGFEPKSRIRAKAIFRYWSNDWDKIGTEF